MMSENSIHPIGIERERERRGHDRENRERERKKTQFQCNINSSIFYGTAGNMSIYPQKPPFDKYHVTFLMVSL